MRSQILLCLKDVLFEVNVFAAGFVPVFKSRLIILEFRIAYLKRWLIVMNLRPSFV